MIEYQPQLAAIEGAGTRLLAVRAIYKGARPCVAALFQLQLKTGEIAVGKLDRRMPDTGNTLCMGRRAQGKDPE